VRVGNDKTSAQFASNMSKISIARILRTAVIAALEAAIAAPIVELVLALFRVGSVTLGTLSIFLAAGATSGFVAGALAEIAKSVWDQEE